MLIFFISFYQFQIHAFKASLWRRVQPGHHLAWPNFIDSLTLSWNLTGGSRQKIPSCVNLQKQAGRPWLGEHFSNHLPGERLALRWLALKFYFSEGALMLRIFLWIEWPSFKKRKFSMVLPDISLLLFKCMFESNVAHSIHHTSVYTTNMILGHKSLCASVILSMEHNQVLHAHLHVILKYPQIRNRNMFLIQYMFLLQKKT